MQDLGKGAGWQEKPARFDLLTNHVKFALKENICMKFDLLKNHVKFALIETS